MLKQFGGKVTKRLIDRYSQSPHWKEGKFQNLVETTMSISIQTLPKILYKQFCENKNREPAKPLFVIPFDKENFQAPADKAKLIWYGHSVVLMRIDNKTLLIDPMLGSNASPVGPFKTKRFSKNTLTLIDDLPEIDLLLLTHDHYDHLDYDSILKLKHKTKQYFVALGMKRHLSSWGIPGDLITEFDWWDSQQFSNIKITFTPTRHFSGRGLTDRAKSLWGGWVFKTENERIYFSGDGGYGEHFKEVGKQLGPFDFGFMECGQYNEHWHQIHMYPEESVQAAIDAQVNKTMAVHWGQFALAQHHWKDPIERYKRESNRTNLDISTPQIGQLFTVLEDNNAEWWEAIE